MLYKYVAATYLQICAAHVAIIVESEHQPVILDLPFAGWVVKVENVCRISGFEELTARQRQ